MSITKSISELGRPVAYYPRIARWLGGDVSAAVFLCQFMYWRGKVGSREIYKTRAEIEEETGIGEDSQRRICKSLQKRGYLSIVKKGLPPVNYYRFDWEAIDAAYAEWLDGGESRASMVANPEQQSPRIPSTTSETTQESTTEITSGATDVAPSDTPGTDIAQPKAPAPLKDTLARYYEEAMTAVHPMEAWANIGKERGAVSTLVKKTRALLPRVPFDSEQELARAMLAAFYDARQNEKGDYWRGAPFTPSALSSRWDKIAARLAQEWQRAREWEELAGDTRR